MDREYSFHCKDCSQPFNDRAKESRDFPKMLFIAYDSTVTHRQYLKKWKQTLRKEMKIVLSNRDVDIGLIKQLL